MRKLKFFGLVLSLVVVGLVACDKGYDAKVIKLSDENGKGYYAPTGGVSNTLCFLSFLTAADMKDSLSYDPSLVALIDDDNAIYATLAKIPLAPSSTNISYSCTGKVVSSKLELVHGSIGYGENAKSDVAKGSLKLEVTKADGSELKLSGTITGVDSQYSEKVDFVYTYTAEAMSGF